MMKTLLDKVSGRYPITEINVGDMSTVKANGMTFSIKAYKAAGLGHISLMSASGFFGLMKMDTLIINPTEKDLPLYSYDRIYAMGNDTLIVELYDTLVGDCSLAGLQAAKAEFADMPDHPLGEHWYDSIKLAESISKKGKKAQTPRFDQLTMEHFAAYLEAGTPKGVSQSETSDSDSSADVNTEAQSPVCDPEAKRKKAAYYVEGLLKNGGPSTDVFKKAIGEEKTAKLFRKVLFGTEPGAN